MENSDVYADSYVAFLDILGFKNMVQKSDQDILQIFKSFNYNKKRFLTAFGKACDPNDTSSSAARYNDTIKKISYYNMSDSVVISVPSSAPYSLEVVIEACLLFQIKLYEFNEPVLFRGAISKGDYYQYGSIAFGPALVEAYTCQEKYSKYPRIIVSGKVINSSDDVKAVKKLLHRDATDRYYYIDCLKEYLGERKSTDSECEKFKEFIESHLNLYEPPSVREKYIWLSEDYNRVVKGGKKISDGTELVLLK